MVGSGDRILLEEVEPESEMLGPLEIPCSEPLPKIESDRTLAGGGLVLPSGSTVFSLDIPGRGIIPVDEIGSGVSST